MNSGESHRKSAQPRPGVDEDAGTAALDKNEIPSQPAGETSDGGTSPPESVVGQGSPPGGLPDLEAYVSAAGDEIAVRIYQGKGRGGGERPAPQASLFDAAEGHKRFALRLHPNSFAVKLDWQHGELVGLRIDGAFPGQPDAEPTSRQRVFRVRQLEGTLVVDLSTDLVAMRPRAATAAMIEQLRVAFRQDILNAASAIVAAGWRASPAPERVDAALPLVLIAQIQHSGGDLLSQLLDGHPEVWAFPDQLKWAGSDRRYLWPRVGPRTDGPLRVARALVAANLEDAKVFNVFGYQGGDWGDDSQRLPFHWSEWAYIEAFLDAWAAKPPRSRRECLDIFMSAYFSAFLDWRGSRQDKKLVAAFTPRVSFTRSDRENAAFFKDYPDGWMISMCRHPVDWYASASRRDDSYGDPGPAMALWRDSAEASLRLKARHPEQVILVSFEALVRDPRGAMTAIAQRLGLTWHQALEVPTFNGMPVTSNAQFESVVGIDPTSIARRDAVEAGVRARIEAENSALHRRFTEAADVA